MQFTLVAGVAIAAIVAAIIYYVNRRYATSLRLSSGHDILQGFCFTAVAAVVPGVVYTAIEGTHPDHLVWWGVALATALGSLFFISYDNQRPAWLLFDSDWVRVWGFVLVVSLLGYGLLLRGDKIDLYV
jgi:hypothetical protein